MDFKKGDIPAPGIKIIGAIKGDANDSFDHYVYRRTDTHEEFTDKEYLKMIFVLGPGGKRIPHDSQAEGKRPVQVDEIRIVGNPDAARIYFKQGDNERSQSMKPAEFEAFLKDYKEMIAKKPPKAKEPDAPKKTSDELKAEAQIKLANDLASGGAGTKLSEIDDMPDTSIAILNKNDITIVEQVKAIGIDGLMELKGIGQARADEIFEIIEAVGTPN